MRFVAGAVWCLTLPALTPPALAREPSQPPEAAPAFVCRDIPRNGSRIKQRLCGAPEVLARYIRERNELNTLVSDRPFPPNGIAPTTALTQ